MSLVALANHLAEKGRGDDKMLVHMTPREVQGLQALALAHGGSLTVNPETGLVEAGFLKKLLPAIAGFALNFIAPGVGTAIGGMLGLGGAAGTAIAVGGLTGLATGSLRQGIMAGLGAYGGASLAGGVQAAGASAAQQAAVSEAAKQQAAGVMVDEALTSQGIQNLAAQQATKDYLAKGALDKFTGGVGALGTEAGRSAFMQGVGGASGLMRAGTAAMLGADAFVPTATSMPSGGGFQYPPRIRPMSWNQYTGQLEQLPMFSAINKAGTTPASAPAPAQEQQPPGMNSGGIVALADGGTPPPLATREQVLQAYRTNPGAELNPNEEAIKYWMDQGLGSFANVVSQTRAANPTLAQQIDAARTAATTQQFANPANTLPNYLGINAVAAGNAPVTISGTAGPGYDYAAATLKTDLEKEINQIYRDVLGRDAEREGLKYWADTGLSAPEIRQQVQSIGSNIGVKVDPTQLATPTAAQLAAQRSILADPTEAAIGIARSGVARGLSDQQIADLVNETYGKSFSAQNVADFMRRQGITRPTSVISGEDTVITPGPIPELPPFAPTTPTLGEPFKPTAPTMSNVVSAYEKGGGSTRMPTITDILPTDRTYTQNQAFALLDGYLKANPNAQYSEVSAFARSKGIPEMQARAAYNEFRFNSLTGASKSAYDYLMGRGPYQVNQVLPGNAPLMRPYLEASGISSAPGFFGRKSTPTTPTRQTAQSAGTGSTTTSGVTGGGTSTTGGNTSAAFMGTTGGAKAAVTGDNRTYADQATIKGGVVVGNNVVDPISGRVIGTITANVDDGTGGIVVGSVIVDPISGRIIGQAEDAGFISRLVDKKVGEQLAPIEERTINLLPERQPERSEDEDDVYSVFRQPNSSFWFDDYGAYGMGMDNADITPFNSGGIAMLAGAARGGQFNLGSYSDGGRLLRGPGDGVSDSIPAVIGNKQPARLADGEFVIPARIVSELGNGSTEAGARKLYAMMDRVQRARAKTTGKGRVAKNTRADKHLPA